MAWPRHGWIVIVATLLTHSECAPHPQEGISTISRVWNAESSTMEPLSFRVTGLFRGCTYRMTATVHSVEGRVQSHKQELEWPRDGHVGAKESKGSGFDALTEEWAASFEIPLLSDGFTVVVVLEDTALLPSLAILSSLRYQVDRLPERVGKTSQVNSTAEGTCRTGSHCKNENPALDFWGLPVEPCMETASTETIVVVCRTTDWQNELQCKDTCMSEAGLERAAGDLPQVPTYLKRHLPAVDGSFDMFLVDGEWVSSTVNNTEAVGLFSVVAWTQALDRACADPDGPRLAVDLGCNVGYMSMLALSLGCDVVCVEPNPMLIPVIARSAAHNIKSRGLRGRFVLVHAAAGAQKGSAKLNVKAKHYGYGKVAPEEEAGGIDSQWGESIAYEVPIVAMSSLLTKTASVLKVDVEGFEKEVATGLDSYLHQFGFEHMFVEVMTAQRSELLRKFSVGCGPSGVEDVLCWGPEIYYLEYEFEAHMALRYTAMHSTSIEEPLPSPKDDFWISCFS